MTSHVVNTDNIIGVNVKNFQDEDLGTIEAIMIDKISGKVAYVVLSYGGFLGLGDKLFALPWEIFSYDKNDDCFRIALDEEKLTNSPGFDKDHWPDMSNAVWSSSIHKYYGTSNSQLP